MLRADDADRADTHSLGMWEAMIEIQRGICYYEKDQKLGKETWPRKRFVHANADDMLLSAVGGLTSGGVKG